ncbi:hypothetical protein [uncultured Campylobacter sp.]|uniref:hypothetical protein n=1 Tax=uncultured Campylobacter sp. TaxID=218934 RepID=UPI00262D3BBE|nr:hypothetical protein [uncultured Campylobacter sp.]
MDEKFQSDTKELDEKFAAIPENLKKRYDRHRFIRRAIMAYWSSAFATFYFSMILGAYLEPFFTNIGIKLSSEIFIYIRDVAIIVLPICATICFLRYTKTKRYSNLFIKDQGDNLLVFTIENFASIVLILYPILLILGSFFVEDNDGGYGIYAFLYGLLVAPICLLIFAICYFFNKSSYTPASGASDLRREPDLATQSAKSAEERLTELNDLDAKFKNLPRNLKNRYDTHRLIRRSSVTFVGFTVLVSWFASFVNNVLGGLLSLAAVLILPYIFTRIYLKSYPTKKYSKLFIKNQCFSLAVFIIENLASVALILYPLALIIAALIAKNNERIIGLFLSGSNVLSLCFLVFVACYLFNRSTYIPKDEA